jgi:glyoxylase-like metal-dependent hydrolase (beta-lactamase superfamily II)
MKTITHGPNLVQLMRVGFVNAYLVREDDGLTLVDTMLPGSEKGVLEAAESLGAPIVRIALTHAHLDHVGSVDALVKELPGAELLISERDARFIAGDRSLDPGEQQGKPRGSWKTVEAKPTRTIGGGERVGSLEVVPSPGHTPGHVAFLDTRDRTLIAGDAYSTYGGLATSAAFYPRMPLVWLGSWHRPTALESAQALRALEPSRLAVGHGSVVNAPGQAMDRAIARGSSSS